MASVNHDKHGQLIPSHKPGKTMPKLTRVNDEDAQEKVIVG